MSWSPRDLGKYMSDRMEEEIQDIRDRRPNNTYKPLCNWCGQGFYVTDDIFPKVCPHCNAPIEAEPTPEEGHPFPHNHTGIFGTP